MKTFKTIAVLAFIFVMTATVKISAQTATSTTDNQTVQSEVKIKTSAQCDDCKGRIEKKVREMKGVSKADLDLDSKVLTVEYDATKTTPEKIRMVIASIGYDADDVKANEHAYKALPKCCQKKETAQ